MASNVHFCNISSSGGGRGDSREDEEDDTEDDAEPMVIPMKTTAIQGGPTEFYARN